MKKIIVTILCALSLFYILAHYSYILFPSDILNNLPSFSLSNWSKPHNALIADPVFQFEPWRIYAKSRILKGELPLWNPNNGGGAPFLANPQTSLLYPLNFIYYLLPISLSLNIMPVLKLILYFIFCYKFLRSIKCTNISAFLGSSLSVLVGFPIVWILWPHTNVFILLPLLLFLTEKLLGKNIKIYLFFISIAYLVGILGGHPETLFYVGIIHFIYSYYRLKNNKSLFFREVIFILLGFLLGAFQLIPFIEYVFKSNLIEARAAGNPNFLFPIQGIIYNVIPFIMGGPHLAFYKPLGTYNFQELIGGYTGFGIVLFVIYAVFRLFNNALIRFFSISSVLVLFISYKIWPFWIFVLLPPFNLIPNNRLMGFFGFFISVLVAISISNANKITINRKIFKKLILSLIIIGVAVFPTIVFLNKKLNVSYPQYINSFIPFLISHILFIIYSTIVLIVITIVALYLRKYILLYAAIGLAILLQVLPVFFNYNSITKLNKYYPTNQLIQSLKKLPQGRIIEIGNLYLPPSINLVYNLQQAQNEDAINVAEYNNAFNNAFPSKGYWGNADNVDLSSLQKFGIKYVVSDYDINLKLVKIQGDYGQVIPISKNGITFKFKPISGTVSQIRIITANFNRNNNCIVNIRILQNNVKVIERRLNCDDFRDSTYITLNIGKVNLKAFDEYALHIDSPDADQRNFVGIRGFNSKPYLGLLYQPEQVPVFQKIWNQGSIYLWSVPDSNLIDGTGKYEIITDEPEQLLTKITVGAKKLVEIKKTYYPGWKAMEDGVDTKIFNLHPFIGIFVHQGTHIISLSYSPLSFLLGIFISGLTAISLALWLIKVYFSNKKTKLIFKDMSIKVRQTNFKTHLLIYSVSFLNSAILFFIFVHFFFTHFKMPMTTAINWLTIHNYPKQQDIFYFVIGMPFLLICTLLQWWYWVCKKR